MQESGPGFSGCAHPRNTCHCRKITENPLEIWKTHIRSRPCPYSGCRSPRTIWISKLPSNNHCEYWLQLSPHLVWPFNRVNFSRTRSSRHSARVSMRKKSGRDLFYSTWMKRTTSGHLRSLSNGWSRRNSCKSYLSAPPPGIQYLLTQLVTVSERAWRMAKWTLRPKAIWSWKVYKNLCYPPRLHRELSSKWLSRRGCARPP